MQLLLHSVFTYLLFKLADIHLGENICRYEIKWCIDEHADDLIHEQDCKKERLYESATETSHILHILSKFSSDRTSGTK